MVYDDIWSEIADVWPHPTEFAPRRWQAEALPVAIDALRQGERPVVSATMGSGKSIYMGAVCRLALRKLRPGGVIVVTAPTEKLVTQLEGSIRDTCGADVVGQYYGKRKQPTRKIVVACNPSLGNLAAELALRKRRCQLLVVDECHRSETTQVRDVVPDLEPASLMGLTATPYRSCASERLSLFTEIAYRYTWQDARNDGVIVPMREVWDANAERHETLDDQCLALIREHVDGPGIISALDIADAERYAAWLTERDLPSEAIHSRQSDTEQQDKILRLQHGALRALVHVSMLQEGVDFPWLRWLCLRRPVGSRLRLVQEIGRGARAHPGKRFFWAIDPHNLISTHGLQHPGAIGEALQAEADKETRRSEGGEGGQRAREVLPPGPSVSLAMQWSQRLWLSMLEAGLADPEINDGHWRSLPPNDRQLDFLCGPTDGRKRGLGTTWARYLPDEHRHAVLAMSRRQVAEQLDRGVVSDLIAILTTVRNASPKGGWQRRKHWKYPWPESIDAPELDPAALARLDRMGRAR